MEETAKVYLDRAKKFAKRTFNKEEFGFLKSELKDYFTDLRKFNPRKYTIILVLVAGSVVYGSMHYLYWNTPFNSSSYTADYTPKHERATKKRVQERMEKEFKENNPDWK